ncbi:membrane protein [Arthrobacter phage Lilmac1015]|uniref:Membrane protein n=1 Tax=Arthrobacter phage Lilmac1015 TaxID=2912653 RepID=A0AA49BPS2_9CAUD|nr:membrane protein [Arthrobacter phage Lilmac1015]
MLEAVPDFIWTDVTPWGIVGLLVLGICTGRFIVPKFYYAELLTSRNEWRATAKSLEKSVEVFARALPDALEVAKTADKILTSVGEKAEENDRA